MTDLSRLSYRMSKQLDMALNDLNHVRENIDEINKIVHRESKYDSDRKMEVLSEQKNEIIEREEKKEEDIPAAGSTRQQHNMTHNRWISSLRNPFSYYY